MTESLNFNFTHFNKDEKLVFQYFLDNLNIELFDIKNCSQLEKYAYYLFNAALNKKKYYVNLGKIYFEVRNYERSFHWFNIAAENNDSYAFYRMGSIYQKGLSNDNFTLIPDDNKAYEYILKAAQNGLVSAQCRLGCYFEQGIGVPQNNETALKWYKKAAMKNNSYAICAIANFYELGLAGLKKNYEEAKRMYTVAEANNYGWAKYKLGNFHEFGLGVPINLETALQKYQEAKELECRMATYHIGTWYENGIYFEKDFNAAMKLYIESVKDLSTHSIFRMNDNSHHACYHIGEIYEKGENVERNIEVAKEWYTYAAYHGSTAAKNKLATII